MKHNCSTKGSTMKLKDIIEIKNEYTANKKYKIISILGESLKINIKSKDIQKTANLTANYNTVSSAAQNNNAHSTVHYFIAMLKAYGIKNIVSSPGTQNAAFNLFIQEDSFFKTYSVVDERSAAYAATGIAFETGEPVVITCTEATASRNYLSALTEAYYRKLPVIACTFYNDALNKYSLSQQYSDRSVSQNDIKTLSVELPQVYPLYNKQKCLTYLNAALSTALYKGEPVHINCPSLLNINHINTVKTLPVDIWRTEIYTQNFDYLKSELKNKKIGIVIGAHSKFDSETENLLSDFAKNYSAPVFCDHTSNYHGDNKILISQAARMLAEEYMPELIIDLGHITGDYTSNKLFSRAKVWRINEDNSFHCRYNIPAEKIFNCSEKYFFKTLKSKLQSNNTNYFSKMNNRISEFKLPDLPFSTPFIAANLAKNLPQDTSLHLGILNSLRCMDYFNLDETINVVCNVGGFGIDGALSTLAGQSFAAPEKKCFGLIGDLAFFYDMNILGNRHISKNLRILLINNNKGAEFHVSYIGQIKDKEKRLDNLVAAGNHYINGAKSWADACNFKYISASNKAEFLEKITGFCKQEHEQPVLFECFTSSIDEEKGLKAIQNG